MAHRQQKFGGEDDKLHQKMIRLCNAQEKRELVRISRGGPGAAAAYTDSLAAMATAASDERRGVQGVQAPPPFPPLHMMRPSRDRCRRQQQNGRGGRRRRRRRRRGLEEESEEGDHLYIPDTGRGSSPRPYRSSRRRFVRGPVPSPRHFGGAEGDHISREEEGEEGREEDEEVRDGGLHHLPGARDTGTRRRRRSVLSRSVDNNIEDDDDPDDDDCQTGDDMFDDAEEGGDGGEDQMHTIEDHHLPEESDSGIEEEEEEEEVEVEVPPSSFWTRLDAACACPAPPQEQCSSGLRENYQFPPKRSKYPQGGRVEYYRRQQQQQKQQQQQRRRRRQRRTRQRSRSRSVGPVSSNESEEEPHSFSDLYRRLRAVRTSSVQRRRRKTRRIRAACPPSSSSPASSSSCSSCCSSCCSTTCSSPSRSRSLSPIPLSPILSALEDEEAPLDSYRRARNMMMNGQWSNAIEEATYAIGLAMRLPGSPVWIAAMYLRAKAYFYADCPDKCLLDCREAIFLLNCRTTRLGRRKNTQSSAFECRRHCRRVHYLAAWVYYFKFRQKGILTAFHHCNVAVRHYREWVNEHNQGSRIIPNVRKFLERYSKVFRLRGRVLAALGRFEKAGHDIEYARSLDQEASQIEFQKKRTQ